MSSVSITTVADLIAQAESSGNQYACRFEAGYQPNPGHISKMQTLIKGSMRTANVFCSMSWGLFQIMGDNLIKLGLDRSPIEYCNDPALQLEFFNRYCQMAMCEQYSLSDIISNESDRLDFARKYNGPGQPEVYGDYLLEVAKRNGIE